MMGNDFKSMITGFSALNKLLVLVLVIEAILFAVDSGAHKKNADVLVTKKEYLMKQKDQVLLLENLYRSLEQKSASLNKGASFIDKYDQDFLMTRSDRDIVKHIAQKNNLRVEWVNQADEETTLNAGVEILFIASLRGGFSDFRPFLLDLLSWPRLRNMPLIQVMAGNGTLDITLNIRVYERGPGNIKEKQP